MEIIHGFSKVEKPVMSEHIWYRNVPISNYRYLISYKIAKRGKSAEPIFPLITRKHSIAKLGAGGDMLKNL